MFSTARTWPGVYTTELLWNELCVKLRRKKALIHCAYFYSCNLEGIALEMDNNLDCIESGFVHSNYICVESIMCELLADFMSYKLYA